MPRSNADIARHHRTVWVSASSSWPAHTSPIIPQSGEMWLLLLVALGLAQGLHGAALHGRVSRNNPEQFMNIVSAAGQSPPQRTCQPLPIPCPLSAPRGQWWGGHRNQVFPIFLLLSLTSCSQPETVHSGLPLV